MKYLCGLAALAAAGLLLQSGPAGARSGKGLEGLPPEGCDIAVQFNAGRYGIDNRAYEKTQLLLEENPTLVAGVTTKVWGDLGERTLCVSVTDPTASRTVFKKLKTLLGGVKARKARMATIVVVTRANERFESKPYDPPGGSRGWGREAQENSRRGVPGGRPW